MNPTLPLTPHCFPSASLTLPPWQVVDPGNMPEAPTAIAFTIRRVLDLSVVGDPARDGLGSGSGANGVLINGLGLLTHAIGTADNVPLSNNTGEMRRVEYTLTFADSSVVVVRVEYYVRPVEY